MRDSVIAVALSDVAKVKILVRDPTINNHFESFIFSAQRLVVYIARPHTWGPGHILWPAAYRKEIFYVHDPAHQGIQARNRIITIRYFWPSLNKDTNS